MLVGALDTPAGELDPQRAVVEPLAADPGVDGIWMNPINPSPNVDWGYDVADYTDIHPDLGTLADLDRLVAEATPRGIRLLLDLVPNHTSNRHPWFREHPDYYVWADEIPNNWQASSVAVRRGRLTRNAGGTTCTTLPRAARPRLVERRVRAEFERILRFWLDRGVAGFRIDVCHALIRPRAARRSSCHRRGRPTYSRAGRTACVSMNRPETHEILRDWRTLSDSYGPARILVGEVYVLDVAAWARFYGSGSDELNLAFNFAFVHADLEAEQMRGVVRATESAAPTGGWPEDRFEP